MKKVDPSTLLHHAKRFNLKPLLSGEMPKRSRVGIAAICILVVGFGLFPIGVAFQAQAESAYSIGLQFYGAGDYTSAAQYFEQAVRNDVRNPDAHYYLADSYMKMSRLRDARTEYQETLILAPGSQAGRFARIALANLQSYTQSSWNQNWHVSTMGSANAVDRYNGSLGEGTDYLDVVSDGGRRIRWSLLKQPLKVFIESTPVGIRNFQPSFVNEIRKALDIWVGVLGHQLNYVQVSDPTKADIRVQWVNAIDTKGHSGDGGTSYTAGLTIPSINNGQLQYMDVKMATFDIEGKPQSSDIIFAVAVHEIGHSFGLLGHSTDENDVMYAQNRHVITPSARDIKTIRSLYAQKPDITNLPPGSEAPDAARATEIAAQQDEKITRLEKQAQTDGMALSYLNLGIAYFQKAQSQKNNSAIPDKDIQALYQKALTAMNTAIQKEPSDPRAYHRRSLVYQGLQDFSNALSDIQKAVSIDPKEPDYYMLQAWYFAKLNRPGESRNALDTYLLYNPGQAASPDVQAIQKELQK